MLSLTSLLFVGALSQAMEKQPLFQKNLHGDIEMDCITSKTAPLNTMSWQQKAATSITAQYNNSYSIVQGKCAIKDRTALAMLIGATTGAGFAVPAIVGLLNGWNSSLLIGLAATSGAGFLGFLISAKVAEDEEVQRS